MAFLSKKVSKIFPSSKRGNCQDDPSSASRLRLRSSQHYKGNSKGNGNGRCIAIFRKLSPEVSKPKASAVASMEGGSKSSIFSVTRKQSMAAKCQQQQESLSTTVEKKEKNHDTQLLLAKGDTFDGSEYYDYENNSEAATLESAPTTPSPRVDTMHPRLMSLPDLAFPSDRQEHIDNPSIPMIMNMNNHHNTNQSGVSSGTTRSNPSSLRLLPRPLPPAPIEIENEKADNNNILRSTCDDIVTSQPKHNHDLPPPVASVSIPVGMYGHFVLPPTPKMTRAYLSSPPPRAGEWDDATLESHPAEPEEQEDDDDYGNYELDNAYDYDTTYETRIANQMRRSNNNSSASCTFSHQAAATIASPTKSTLLSLSEQQQQEKRDKATAQAMATMKPWIERAALLALLQTRASSHREQERRNQRGSSNIRRSQAAIEVATPSPRFRQREIGRNRALLASLEPLERRQHQGQDYSEAVTATATAKISLGINERQQLQQQHSPPPRIVKWHIVGRSY